MRKNSVTLKTVERVGKLIALGMPTELACAVSGVNYGGWRTALRRNPSFDAALKRYRGEKAFSALMAIWTGEKTWQSRAWLLERCFQPHFLLPRAGNPDVSLTVNNSPITPEVIAAAQIIAAKVWGSNGSNNNKRNGNGQHEHSQNAVDAAAPQRRLSRTPCSPDSR